MLKLKIWGMVNIYMNIVMSIQVNWWNICKTDGVYQFYDRFNYHKAYLWTIYNTKETIRESSPMINEAV